jgi:guanine nucleotide-binding protein subunit beta-2-like 1 protein
MSLKFTFTGHTSQINSLDMAPKTSYLASGGKDGQAMIWNLLDGKFLSSCDAECNINVVLFAPKKYWLILGTDKGIKVWDLPSKNFIDNIVATPLDPN